PLRPYFTDAYFAQMQRQLNALKDSGRTNYVERISVLGVMLRGWMQQEDNDHIIAIVSSRIIDYTLDDRTGALVSGSRTREKFMTYEMDLCRKTGMKSGTHSGLHTINCPNCGAPLDINTTAKCPYCDSIVTVKEHDWAICGIKGLSQRTS
ncbi:MAG: TIM44-like domain-containing protein, partial [Clostridia bacterium]|nr:TIM44-like domain-containing protein [Clostridia bacterium]